MNNFFKQKIDEIKMKKLFFQKNWKKVFSSPVRQGLSQQWEEIFHNEDGIVLVIENEQGLNTPHMMKGILLKIPEGEILKNFSSILKKIEMGEEDIWVEVSPGQKRKITRRYRDEWNYFELFDLCVEGSEEEIYFKVLKHLDNF